MWQALSAALNCALFVSTDPKLKIGPLPEVFGAGRLIPWLRMHSAKLASALR
jgi:hypothetical protein